jgi:DNA-binding transcriptional MerR regulator
VPILDVESVEDLKKLLKEIGYSVGAIEEILKWYKQDDANRRA